MATFTEAVAGILRDRTCNLLSNPIIDGRQWGPRPPFVGEGVATNPLTRRWYNNAIDGLRSLFCEAPVEEIDNVLPDFSGGQCPGSRYQVNWSASYSWERTNGTTSTTNLTNVTSGQCNFAPFILGPISGIRIDTSNLPALQIVIDAGNGARVVSSTTLPQFKSYKGGSGTINTISVCPGFDDDCGDPPPEYKPINIFNFTENIEYIDNSETTNIQLGDFNLFAPIFLPGSIQIPFSLNVGEVNFSGSLFPNGTINISPDFNIGVGSQNDPSPTDEPDLDDDEEYEIEPSEEQESIIVGAWVVVTQDSARATQVAEGGVTHFYPRQGILKFRMAFGTSGFTYSQGIDVKTRRAYIPVPRTGRAIGADWFGYSGNAATVTLAYAEITPNLLPASD